MSQSEVHVFIVSGRSGSGKTTVVNEVTHLLTQPPHDIPHVHIDGDNLDFLHPKESQDPTPNITLLNLQSLFRNYYTHRRAACGVVWISGSAMIQQWRDIDRVIQQVCNEVQSDDVPPVLVRSQGIVLHASDSTAKTRLQQREIGTDLERHLKSSKRIAGLLHTQFHNPKQHPMHVLHVHTDKGSVSDSASRIVEYIRRTTQGDEASRAKLEARSLEPQSKPKIKREPKTRGELKTEPGPGRGRCGTRSTEREGPPFTRSQGRSTTQLYN